jgi:hypothetical protein
LPLVSVPQNSAAEKKYQQNSHYAESYAAFKPHLHALDIHMRRKGKAPQNEIHALRGD